MDNSSTIFSGDLGRHLFQNLELEQNEHLKAHPLEDAAEVNFPRAISNPSTLLLYSTFPNNFLFGKGISSIFSIKGLSSFL